MTSKLDKAKLHEPAAERVSLVESFLRRFIGGISVGRLTLRLPDGRSIVSAAPAPGPHGQIEIRRWRALVRFFAGGDVAFAAAYADGDWTTPDLYGLLAFGMANDAALAPLTQGSSFSRAARKLYHRLRRNSVSRSRRNIRAHYDLGNDFYASWLDRDLNYSSGIYRTGNETLDEAQAAKLAKIGAMLGLHGGERVLEIGCGWGALAIRLAQENNCRVTGLTLSEEQRTFASGRVEQSSAQDRVEILLQDYRESRGQFDRVVSIEMIEAVGEEYWPLYFQTVRDRLKPGGLAVLQAITIAEDRFSDYRQRPDFIQRFIFPGGMLPTKSLIREHAMNAGLRCAETFSFGESYARTLAAWRKQFSSAENHLELLGYDAPFRRLWNYYLAYCEAGFSSGAIDVGLYRFEVGPPA